MGLIRGIVFDLDDTLCAYWDAGKKGLDETFRALTPKPFTPEQMLEAWVVAFHKFVKVIKSPEWYSIYLKEGHKTRVELMARALRELGIDDPELAQAMGDRYGEERDQALKLFPESLDVLETFFGRYPLALMTNGPADVQRQEIATLGIGHYFDPILIEGEMDKGKPNPEVFQRVLDAWNLRPEEILMVGNSYAHDIRPAVAQGWQTAWIRRPSDVAPSATEPEQKPEDGPEPTVTINDLRELFELVGHNRA